MLLNNRIVLNLNTVQWAKFYYSNGSSITHTFPKLPTARGVPLDTIYSVFRAGILGIIDEWIPMIQLKLHSSSFIYYSGDKAKSLWRAWNSKIFKSK